MPPSFEATVVGTSAAWRELCDRINMGMHHELNGRFSAIFSLLQIVAMKGEMESDLLMEMERETDRLGEALELLRTIPAFGRSPGEVVAPHELVPKLIRLAAMERGVHSIEFEATVEPDVGVVQTDPNTLSQCLLIVFASAARDAQSLGGRRVCADVAAGDSYVEISVGVPAAPTEETVEPLIEAKELLPRIADDGLEAVRSSIEATGASIRLYGDTNRFTKSYVIRLPLAEAPT